jgi:hypothetical protein
MKKSLLIRVCMLILTPFLISETFSQDSLFVSAEKELSTLLTEMRKTTSDSIRTELNNTFGARLYKQLCRTDAQNWPFDSLNIAKLVSEDGKVRIFNWNIQQNDKSNLYSAIVCHWASGKIVQLETMQPLQYIGDEDVFSQGKWPGGLFYNIIQRRDGPADTYTLLSWDGYNPAASRKTIEILTFDKDNLPVFGAPLFKTKNGIKNRVISAYASRAAFTQNYDKQTITLYNVRKSQRKINDKMIVLDRLVPMNESLEGQRWAYVPAGNIYDAYVFYEGFWTFVEDIAPRNPAAKGKKEKEKPVSYELFPPR